VANAVIDEWGARLSHATFKVYIALCRYGNNGPFTISYTTLCERLDLSRATLAKALDMLVREGLIRVERNTNAQGNDQNTYVLLPIPDSSISELSDSGQFNQRTDPGSVDELTLVQPVNCVLKNEENKEREKEIAPMILRIRERDAKRLAARR
jgi:DNA-binding transcriptional MocR family regulator